MGIVSKDNRQIKLYYDSTNDLGRKVRAHTETFGDNILAIDLMQTKLTGTEWADLADLLGVKVQTLIAQDHPIFKDLFGDQKVELEEHDALRILENNPETLVFPIAVRGNKAIQAKSSNDVRKLLDPDTGEIPQP